MAQRSQRSLRHEYELYVELEIENYKDSVSRTSLLKIGDEAVAALESSQQLALTEMVLWGEVDRIIRRRLRLPTYRTWRARRVRLLESYRRPEHWGLPADSPLVRDVQPAAEGHVLIAGGASEGPALYLAAHGSEVTAIDAEADAVQRVVAAAEAAGLTQRVRGCIGDLREWAPDVPLSAVVCSSATLARLAVADRSRILDTLQGATRTGGIHLVEGGSPATVPLDELRSHYRGWEIVVRHDDLAPDAFVARKAVA
jgi:hypothetical protein